MSVKTVLASVVGFIGHYGAEAKAIGSALSSLVGAIPMEKGDRANILDVISRLENAGDTIAEKIGDLLAAANTPPVPVTINKADIEKAVAAVLPGLVAKAVADAVAKLPAPTPAPAAAPAGDKATGDKA